MDIPYRTSDGLIDLNNLRYCDLTADKIADGLSKINRFNGRTPDPWSVASHSVLVSQLLPPDLKPHGLLHDAHEFILGDFTSPALDFTDQMLGPGETGKVKMAITRAKHLVDCKVHRAWGLREGIHLGKLWMADKVACDAEMHVFFGAPAITEGDRKEQFDLAVELIPALPKGSGWEKARDVWLHYACGLANNGYLTLPDYDPTPVRVAQG